MPYPHKLLGAAALALGLAIVAAPAQAQSAPEKTVQKAASQKASKKAPKKARNRGARTASSADLQGNAYKRCEAHADDSLCRARVRGGDDVRITGSIPGGGLLRENLLAHHAVATGKPVHMTWDRKADLTTYARVPTPTPWRDPARWYK